MSNKPGDTGRLSADGHDAESDWQRRRRIAEVFGDVLPDITGDERPSSTPRRDDTECPGDRWLREQVPPHHGG